MSKIITEELIQERLKLRSLAEHYGATDEDTDYKQLSNYYDFQLTEDWRSTYDYYIYRETTADGYEVWVACEDPDKIWVGDHVHYYDSDLDETIKDAMRNGNEIYVDDMEESYINAALEELYEEMRDDIRKEIIEKLEDEGYTREEQAA